MSEVTKAPPRAEKGPVTEVFVGLILLPIVGNAAEHAKAVMVVIKDKMDLAIGVAVGSSMQVSIRNQGVVGFAKFEQIALLVLPLVVVTGWIANKPQMDLNLMDSMLLFSSCLFSLVGTFGLHPA